jgi:hypothetical protein
LQEAKIMKVFIIIVVVVITTTITTTTTTTNSFHSTFDLLKSRPIFGAQSSRFMAWLHPFQPIWAR